MLKLEVDVLIKKSFLFIQQLPSMECMPGTEIRYTSIPTRRYPEGATPAEITKHSMDATFQVVYTANTVVFCLVTFTLRTHTA